MSLAFTAAEQHLKFMASAPSAIATATAVASGCLVLFAASAVAAALDTFLGLPVLALGAFAPPTFVDMPCSGFVCPSGYITRWDAEALFCEDGACNANDTDRCCTLGRFFSHSWRVLAAANVTEMWEVRRIRFFQDEFCFDGNASAGRNSSADAAVQSSEATTAPGVHHKWRGWPSGAAFSHHRGHGSVAARAFVPDTAPTPRNPSPVREVWTSGGPCEEGQCFLGFTWESDIDRSPLGSCTPKSGGSCASEALLRRAGHLRIACAEVEQGNETGRYSEALALQLLETVPSGRIWRTVARAFGLSGGLVQLRM
eukprot:TRINITY_DN55938_c0_g1_i1.p1 TRINITY_DN55938_c0_g1~~TRINITY_DN55938_c0_g1_i1.p1  ORF type:complete len:313 (+),score=53.35 TRINITY_DN55938_c0_g1_i1:46-984(+)